MASGPSAAGRRGAGPRRHDARGGAVAPEASGSGCANDAGPGLAVETRGLNLWYGDFQALFDVGLRVKQGVVTSMIGPSGCGKSTVLRTCNRIAERLSYVRTTGNVFVHGEDVFGPGVEIVQVRKQVGMVFQRPNPLPVSIRANVLFGFQLHEARLRRTTAAEEDAALEAALRRVLLWDAVKDRLDRPATSLSLEEQQKLCIARLLPVKPRVLLMDEPCAALDPAGTEAVEEMIRELSGDYTILIVTHNLAQARRTSSECVFMLMGRIAESGATADMFRNPRRSATADYIEGRYG